MKYFFTSILLLMFFFPALADNMLFHFDIEPPVMGLRGFENDYPVMMKPSEPMIPYVPVMVLLPMGNSVEEVKVEFSISSETLRNVHIPLGSKQLPVSYKGLVSKDNYHTLSGIYPGKSFNNLGIHRKNGYDILLLNLYPYQFDIERKELAWKESFRIKINTVYDFERAEEQNRYLVTNDRVRNSLNRLVINPEVITTYHKNFFTTLSSIPVPSDPHTMIIITGDEVIPLFDEYIQWKEQNGIDTGIFSVEEIYLNYDGVDQQEKIRNFIIDAYETYSLTENPLEYVLIGGGDTIVPVRGMYCFVEGLWNDYEDHNIPSDVYYSHLDGNWDANGNQIYGELDDGIDWFAEVAIGRIPATNSQEFYNFFNKTMFYADNNVFSNDIAVMIGQNLDEITWGGDYKNEIIPILPGEFFVDTYYEMDGTYNGLEIQNRINGGIGILNHLGHSNHNVVFGINSSSAQALHNSEYGFAYSQGCNTAAFDQIMTPEGQSIAQRLVNVPGGFFAFIGNTRYGWYWPGSTEGASQLYDIAFFEGLFQENIREIGEALNYSREILVSEAIENNFEHHLWANGFMLWTFYNQILFGDPSIQIKDATNSFPYLLPEMLIFDDYLGDGDGIVNPGETISMYIELVNQDGWAQAENISGQISFLDSEIELMEDFSFYPDAMPGSMVQNIQPFMFSIPYTIPYGDYPFDLTITAQGTCDQSVFTKNYTLKIPISLKQKHWPWASDVPVNAAPVFHNTGPDHSMLIAGDASTNFFFLSSNAEYIYDPVSIEGNMLRSFALADLTGSGEYEIIVANRSGKIFLLNLDGSQIWYYESNNQIMQSPMVSDITGDGFREVIVFTADRRLIVVDRFGEEIAGFPYQLPGNSLVELAVASSDEGSFIVVGQVDGQLYLFDSNGSVMENFPLQLDGAINVSPVILDNLTVVTATNQNLVYLVSPDGEIISEFQTENRIIGEPVVADFTEDGFLEIAFVTSTGKIYIIDQTATVLPGYPVEIFESVTQSPLAADINNDGSVDIIVASVTGKIYGFDVFGQSLDMLPAPLNLQPASPLFIADLDHDGDYEIGFGTSTGISVIDYKFLAGQKTPWAVYRGNQRRTGFYGDNNILSAKDIVVESPELHLRQNFPNPFNISTRIKFSIDEPGKVRIVIYNIRGQRVKEVYSDFTESGLHSIEWNGKDDTGSIVASGIYFYRMTTERGSLVNKMLLLK